MMKNVLFISLLCISKMTWAGVCEDLLDNQTSQMATLKNLAEVDLVENAISQTRSSQLIDRLFANDAKLRDEALQNAYFIPYLTYKFIVPGSSAELIAVASEAFTAQQMELGGRTISFFDTAIESVLKNHTLKQELTDLLLEITTAEFAGIDFSVLANFKLKTEIDRLPKPNILRRMGVQLRGLQQVLQKLKKVISKDLHPVNLDRNLYAFYGFHQHPDERQYRQRPWQKVSLTKINPQQVTDMEPWEFGQFIGIAMNIEEPIQTYTSESGESLRYIIPSLARFMGKNEEQQEAVKNDEAPWCESAWCSEERRHANALANAYEGVLGVKPYRVVNTARPSRNDETGAFHHLFSRDFTEWSASSAYFFMSPHAEGELLGFLENIRRDELKHYTIVASAGKYLTGYRPQWRLRKMVESGLAIARYSKRSAKKESKLTTYNPVSMLEAGITFVMMEAYLRRYLKDLPVNILQLVFDSPSRLPELAQQSLSPEKLAALSRRLNEEREKRMDLSRWPKTQREAAMEQIKFEKANEQVITNIIKEKLDGFKGAEIIGSEESNKMKDKIKNLDAGRMGLSESNKAQFKQIIFDQLRMYQFLQAAEYRGSAVP